MGKKRSRVTKSSEKQALKFLQKYRQILQGRRNAIRAALNKLCCSGKYVVSESRFEELKCTVDASRLHQILPIAGEPLWCFCLPEKDDESSRFIRLAVELMNAFCNSEDTLARSLDAGIPATFVSQLFAAGVIDGRDGLALSQFNATQARIKGGKGGGKLRKPEHRIWLQKACKVHKGKSHLPEHIAGTLMNLYGYKVSGKVVGQRLKEYGLVEEA